MRKVFLYHIWKTSFYEAIEKSKRVDFSLFQYLWDQSGLRLGKNGLLACLLYVHLIENQLLARCAGDLNGLENISLIASLGHMSSTGEGCVLCCQDGGTDRTSGKVVFGLSEEGWPATLRLVRTHIEKWWGVRTASWVCVLCSHTKSHAQRIPCLVSCSALTVLKFLKLFKQKPLCFYSILGSANCEAVL